MTNLNDVIATALVKKLKPETLEQGEYNLDGKKVLVSFSGKLVKGAATERTPTVNIPLKVVLALVLQRAGFQREQIKQILVWAMTEAIRLGEKGEDFIAEFIKDLDLYEEQVKATLAAMPKVPVEGKVITKNVEISMEVVE